MYVLDLGPPLEEQTTELLSNISPSIMEGEEGDGDHHLYLREPVKYYFTYLVHKGGEGYSPNHQFSFENIARIANAVQVTI